MVRPDGVRAGGNRHLRQYGEKRDHRAGPDGHEHRAVSQFQDPRERVLRLQFRAEFFNVTNRVNLGQPNATLRGANMGRITTAGAARVFKSP